MHQFPAGVLAEADTINIQCERQQNRELVSAITIDGPYSRDLDDAFSLEYLPDRFIVHVSIADVSEFILPDSLLFKEALKRVTTRYLTNSNIPMLPVSISEDSLSLLNQQKRPALTFSITLSRELEIINTEIHKSVLFNKRQLNYAQVDYIIDSCPDDADYQLLNDCYILARRLMDKRRKQGALVIFDLQNLLFTNEEGQLLKMKKDNAHKSNIIIQEFMILANSAVAQLAAERDYLFLFRNHTAKQTTPDREEILEQLQNAANNIRFLESLNKRSGFWFNKAKYEPWLKGHYGLNLPAYTHITSPLRRVSDLINHTLLKAQLWHTELLFNSEELNNMALSINDFILKSSEEKKIFFKEQSLHQTRDQLNNIDVELLADCSNKEFKTLLKEICRSRILPDEFEEILMKRLAENNIGVEHIAIILFEAEDYDEKWKQLRIKVLETIVNIPGFSIQILNNKMQTGLFSNFRVDVKDVNSIFAARVITGIDGKELSTNTYFAANNKKEAQQIASNEFLKSYLNNQLVPAEQTREADSLTNNSIDENLLAAGKEINDEIIEENYVGQLTELCINRKYSSAPVFEFTQTGPSHTPTINCICKIKIGDEIKQTTNSSSSKKKAKQLSAKKMLDIILDYSINELTEKGIGVAVTGTTDKIEENYIGLLHDLCSKAGWHFPVFQFSQSGLSHQPIFTCKVNIKTPDGVYTASGSSSNKKMAKQIASQKLLEQIE